MDCGFGCHLRYGRLVISSRDLGPEYFARRNPAKLAAELANRIRPASDAVEQLMDQLAAAREEHAAMAAQLKAEFNAEVAALRRELAEGYALMERLRMLNAFAQYQRSETDSIN
jgi:hypothetical protein